MDSETLIEQLGRVAVAGRILELRRAWLQSQGHLLLEYADGQGVVAGQWFEDEERLRCARESTARAASPGDAVIVGAGSESVLLQLGGADRKLAALRDVAGLPGATLLRHRAEKRGVVRVEGSAGTHYVKVVRPERAAAIRRAGESAAATGLTDSYSVPQLLFADDESGISVWSGLPGRPLFELFGEEGAAERWLAAGRALRALHSATPAARLSLHDGAAEALLLNDWQERLARTGAALADRLARHVASIAGRLSEPADEGVVLHRDFYDKQVLWEGGRPPGLLDFDTLAYGEAALDLANALVHLDLRGAQGRCGPAERAEAAGALLEGYAPSRRVGERLEVYANATRIRLACVYYFRPGGVPVTEAMLAALGSPVSC